MNIVAKKIEHNTLGIGRVVKIQNNRIFIRFDNDNVLHFAFPDDILSLLFFVNPSDNEMFSKEYGMPYDDISINVEDCDEIEPELDDDLSYEAAEKLVRLLKNHYPNYNSFGHMPCYYDGFWWSYNNALQKEINYLKKTGGKKYQVVNGSVVAQNYGKFIYVFETDTELNFMPESLITLYLNQYETTIGNVIFCEENLIMFSCDELDRNNLLSLEISSQGWVLLESLQKALESLKDKEQNDIVQMILAGPDDENMDELLVGQESAISHSISNPLTFIWGPPGTGKTTTLTKLVMHFVKNNKRVLMLSQSNVSVDGVILKLNETHHNYIKTHPSKVVRYGYPKDKQLSNDSNLSTKQIALKDNEKLKVLYDELLSEKKKHSKKSFAYGEINKKLASIGKQLKDYEGNIVKKADFVATTISKAIIDPFIFEQKFDVVIIDEVSMAYTPQVVFAASLAKTNFVCLGDFCQLPATVQNPSDDNILRNDIFEYYGVPYKSFSNLVMLNTQYRMHPEIASFVSDNMYSSLLSSHSSTNKRNDIAERLPFKNESLCLFDTSSYNTRCMKSNDDSHFNILSAFICAKTVAECMNNKDTIGIITPYSTQAKLINTIIKEIIPKQYHNLISCNTVHQFQGSERDIIIFDSVDTHVQKHPGAMLSSSKSNEANRLFNVAITRARGKFVCVSDADYMQSHLTHSLLFYKYLYKTSNYYSRLDVDYNNDFLRYDKSKLITYDDIKDAELYYTKDIIDAKDKIIVDLPLELCYSKSMKLEFNDIVNIYGSTNPTNRKLIIRAKNKEKLNDNIFPFAVNCSNAYCPITIIDKRIIWYENPMKKYTKNKLYWRIDSSTIASQLYNLLKI